MKYYKVLFAKDTNALINNDKVVLYDGTERKLASQVLRSNKKKYGFYSLEEYESDKERV